MKDSEKMIDRILASALSISAGPYSGLIHSKHIKKRPRDESSYKHYICCCICGSYDKTLCNSKDGNKICIDCKRKSEME